MDILVIVDMQNDFISGALANPAADAIVPEMCELIKNFNGIIVRTKDTHYLKTYMNSNEGRHLPIPHCIIDTEGWEIDERIKDACEMRKHKVLNGFLIGDPTNYTLLKDNFGSINVGNWLRDMIDYNTKAEQTSRIIFVGTCTDICVVSNALIAKAVCPEADIIVIEDLCAGLTPEKHKAAIETMRSCQIEVVKGYHNIY